MTKPTINDVAKLAGVSPSSVSLFLNERPGLGEDTKARIADAIAELGYVPRSNGSKNKSRGFVGLVVEKLPASLTGDLFYADVATGIQKEAENLGYSIAISVIDKPSNRLPRLVEEESVAGLIAIGGGDISDEFLRILIENNTSLVTVDNHSNLQPLNSVVVDNYRGAYRAIQYLIELGHRRIAIIRGPEKYKSLTERYYGYVNAMVDAGLGVDRTLIQEPLSKGLPDKGFLEMKSLLEIKQPPTAVFAVSDRTALGAIAALEDADLTVPDDMSIVGFDDMPPRVYSAPDLTTITSQRVELGKIAMQRLHNIIENPDQPIVQIVMPSQLVQRDSCSEPRKHDLNFG